MQDATFETGPNFPALRQFDLPTVRSPVRVRARAVLTLGLVLFNGCASVPKDYPRKPSVAYGDYTSTAIGAYLEKAADSRPGQSGFAILP